MQNVDEKWWTFSTYIERDSDQEAASVIELHKKTSTQDPNIHIINAKHCTWDAVLNIFKSFLVYKVVDVDYNLINS